MTLYQTGVQIGTAFFSLSLLGMVVGAWKKNNLPARFEYLAMFWSPQSIQSIALLYLLHSCMADCETQNIKYFSRAALSLHT